ncbi:hypothetical protein RJ639_007680 [Escallonia herrerae]|uniref:AMP-binding enzyme C-terminal domain-containing protein n=1 Tax=Escallonia herrerae TaxID=1293975 RepID=A0AA88VVU9_9ASTE|nr:hypothetical protein RJ639_007680 [Escallonia herrerae]
MIEQGLIKPFHKPRFDRTQVQTRRVSIVVSAPDVLDKTTFKEEMEVGMTETCSSLTFMILYDPMSETADQPFQATGYTKTALAHKLAGVCVGKPAPHVEIRVSVEDSCPAGPILTRGPHIMLRYCGQSPREASCPGDESWLETGDIGQIDDCGNVWLIGRTKGRIKSGGENVYPEETVLAKHPGVAGSAVVGVPDSRLTEIVVACIQVKGNWKWANYTSDHSIEGDKLCLSSEVLHHFCKQKNLSGNSNAVAADGFPYLRKFGLFSTNFLFRSSLYDMLTGCFVITIRQVGATNAAIGSSFSSGHTGFIFFETPHIAPLSIKPLHSLFCSRQRSMAIAPPNDSPYRKAATKIHSTLLALAFRPALGDLVRGHQNTFPALLENLPIIVSLIGRHNEEVHITPHL